MSRNKSGGRKSCRLSQASAFVLLAQLDARNTQCDDDRLLVETIAVSNDFNARLAVAAGLVKQKALDEAILHLKGLLQDEPKNELVLGMLAATHAQIGMHARAIEEYQQVLEINPENYLARFQKGLVQSMLGLLEDALETWQPMLELEGEFMANFHSALALIDLERMQVLRPFLEKAEMNMPADHPLQPELRRQLASMN
jgi:tetratricopeptide (TPR) repeat protein